MKQLFRKKITTEKLFLALIINSFFFIVSQIFFGLNYEMLDETIFSELIADHYYNLGVFSNYFLFVILGALQNIIYPLNAYVIVALILGFFAMTTLSYIIYIRFDVRVATGVVVVLNGFFSINHFATISFTRLPAILCVCGYLTIYHFIEEKKYGMLFWGSILIVIGSMYRFVVFEVATVMFMVFMCTNAIITVNNFKNFKCIIKKILEPRRCVLLLFVIMFCFSIKLIGSSVDIQQEGIDYFRDYTALRSSVWDYEIPSYEMCKEEYNAIDIDENDLLMLKGHFLDDKGAFSIKKLAEIKSIKDRYYQNKSFYIVFKDLINDELFNALHLRIEFIIQCSVLLIVVLFMLIMRKKDWLLVLSLLATAFVFLLYLYFIGRVPYRAVYSIWLSVIIYLVYSIQENRFRSGFKKITNKFILNKKVLITFLLFSIVVSGAFWGINGFRNYKNDFKDMQNARAGINAYIKEHPNDKFELCRSANLLEGNIDNKSIYYINNEGRFKNSHIFNGTYYALPYYIDFNNDVFGTDNMFLNLLNKNVYYVDDSNNYKLILEQYLEKYYSNGENVSFKIIDTIDNYQIIEYYLD